MCGLYKKQTTKSVIFRTITSASVVGGVKEAIDIKYGMPHGKTSSMPWLVELSVLSLPFLTSI